MHTKAGITGRNPLKGKGHAQTKTGITGRKAIKDNGHAQRKTGITGRKPLKGGGHVQRKTGITRRKETIVEKMRFLGFALHGNQPVSLLCNTQSFVKATDMRVKRKSSRQKQCWTITLIFSGL